MWLQRFKKWLQRVNPFTIDAVIKEIRIESELLKQRLNESFKLISELHEDFSLNKNILQSVGEFVPDIMWAKDLNGKYLYANKAIRDTLLFDNNPIGKTDCELAIARKNKVGNDNHTFGEVCGNSDEVVLAEKRPVKFFEYGIISNPNPKMIYLVVYKNILRNQRGEIIGTCGVGRDITEEYETLAELSTNLACLKCGNFNQDKFMEIFTKYEFKEGDHLKYFESRKVKEL